LLSSSQDWNPTVVDDWPPGSLLATLPDAARQRLLQRGATLRYSSPSKIIFREGDKSRFVVVILRGVVKVTASVPGGGPDALLAIRMGGDAVGEFAALDQLPRSATVTTCGPVMAQVIKSEDFIDCIRRDPDISHAVSRAIAAKMRVATARRVDFSGSDVPTRVARVLLQLVQAYGRTEGNRAVLTSPLSQAEIASLAVASGPAVHRVLRTLREHGVVSTGYRTIAVIDLNRLREVAYP
jgi:CRP/FNR family transcriptional regulator, cyclic AMP receptor protein